MSSIIGSTPIDLPLLNQKESVMQRVPYRKLAQLQVDVLNKKLTGSAKSQTADNVPIIRRYIIRHVSGGYKLSRYTPTGEMDIGNPLHTMTGKELYHLVTAIVAVLAQEQIMKRLFVRRTDYDWKDEVELQAH